MFARSLVVLVLLCSATALQAQKAPTDSKSKPSKAKAKSKSPAQSSKSGAADAGDEISLEDWGKTKNWALLTPKKSLVELGGYFRTRADLLRRLDFGLPFSATNPSWERRQRYVAASDGQADFTGANLRLRVTPTINVSHNLHVVTTLDLLDNVILGSTPSYFGHPSDGAAPVHALTGSQSPPRRGVNALSDSVTVRRLYARVTALNEKLELRVGRMPDHWGLGMMTNSGDCLDCNYGDVVDRIALTVKFAEHLFTPMFSFISSGPVATPFGDEGGQPIDAVTFDDVEQYSLRVARLDPADVIEERRAHDETVLNYGVWGKVRRQYRDLPNTYWSEAFGDTGDPSDSDAEAVLDPAYPVDPQLGSVRRDALLVTGDGFLQYYDGPLELSIEGAVTVGQLKDTPPAVTQSGSGSTTGAKKTSILQVGGAFETRYRFTGEYDGATFALKAGGASGDSAPGFGALDQASTQRGETSLGQMDLNLNNFQFSPDYHVDLLLFRQIIGTVTDAWYVRPQISYEFDNEIMGTAAVVYSQALFNRSTPGKAQPLGLEVDAELSYGMQPGNLEKSGLKAAIAGGMLFPFSALRVETDDDAFETGSFAWTIQARMYLTF